MHKLDQMTPKERMAGFKSGQDIDRIPAMPFISTVASKVAGMTHRERRNSAENTAKAQIVAYERFGHDSISVDYGLHGVGIALGSTISDPEDAPPAIVDFVLKDLKNIDQLDMSKVELKNDDRFQRHYHAAEILLNKLGDECNIGITITGVFTAAASIYPTELLLRAIRKDPENTHKLMRFCTESLRTVYLEFAKLGVGFSLCDPVASGTILQRRQYQEFVKPYTTELVDALHKSGAAVSYHICGDSSSIMEDMLETGVDNISLDNIVDMEMAKTKIGDRICLVGNIDPVGVFMLGEVHDGIDDMDEAVKTCFRKTYDSPQGFIIASGCDLPKDVPLENIERFMTAARKYGKWPLDGNRYN